MTTSPDRSGDMLPDSEVRTSSATALSVLPRRRQSPDGGWIPSHTAASEQPGLDMRRYVRVLRQRWRVVLAAFAIVTAGVAIGSISQDPEYRASGTIEIRKQAAEVVPVEALFQTERISDQYLQTQYGVLRSPALLRRVLADSVLAARMRASVGYGVALQSGKGDDALVERIQRKISVDPVAGSRIVRVTFQAEDARLAADVVNAIIAAYMRMREEAVAAALARLAEQADSVRAGVLTAEAELQRFVQRTGLAVIVGVAGESGTVPEERLRLLNQELTRAETEGYRAEAAVDAAEAQTTSTADSDLLRSLRVRLAELQGEHSRLRSTFTDSFPRIRQLQSELSQLDSLVTTEQRRVGAAMTGEHRAATRRRQLLRNAVDQQRVLMDKLAVNFAEYGRRHRDLDGQTQLYAMLQQKRKEAAVAAALSTMDVAVLDAAIEPLKPVLPLPKRDVPLGALAGLMLGIGLAFLRDISDVSVRTLDAMNGLSNTRVLALIPAVRGLEAPRSGVPGAALRPADTAAQNEVDAVAEAFRGLRTSLLFENVGALSRTLLVTSATPGEGKTFVSANLASSLAMLGRKVLVVDADLRRPSLRRIFNRKCTAGLSSYLDGALPWREMVCRDVVPGLDLLPSRAESQNPSDLLSSPAMQRLLAEAQSSYDFVVIDAPALFINAPDARILAQIVDGVVLVVRSETTPRDLVSRLVNYTPNLVGVVLNRVDVRQLPGYYREYSDGSHAHTRGQ